MRLRKALRIAEQERDILKKSNGVLHEAEPMRIAFIAARRAGHRVTIAPSMLRAAIGGSINEVGWRFQPFRINGLELVAQICPRWNPLTSWMRQLEDFHRVA